MWNMWTGILVKTVTNRKVSAHLRMDVTCVGSKCVLMHYAMQKDWVKFVQFLNSRFPLIVLSFSFCLFSLLPPLSFSSLDPATHLFFGSLNHFTPSIEILIILSICTFNFLRAFFTTLTCCALTSVCLTPSTPPPFANPSLFPTLQPHPFFFAYFLHHSLSLLNFPSSSFFVFYLSLLPASQFCHHSPPIPPPEPQSPPLSFSPLCHSHSSFVTPNPIFSFSFSLFCHFLSFTSQLLPLFIDDPHSLPSPCFSLCVSAAYRRIYPPDDKLLLEKYESLLSAAFQTFLAGRAASLQKEMNNPLKRMKARTSVADCHARAHTHTHTS